MNHNGGAHGHPHDEDFVMRLFSSHVLNLKESEKKSVEILKARLNRSTDSEIKTHKKGYQFLTSSETRSFCRQWIWCISRFFE